MENYLGTIRNIKKHPLAERKLKNVTSEHLQSFFDLLSFGGVHPDGKEKKGYSKDYIQKYVGDEPFLMTYGDGVCDVEIDKLIEFHKRHGKLATLTAVKMAQDKGILDITKGSRII